MLGLCGRMRRQAGTDAGRRRRSACAWSATRSRACSSACLSGRRAWWLGSRVHVMEDLLTA